MKIAIPTRDGRIDDKGRVKMSVRAALRDAKAAEAEAAGITE